MEWQQRNDLEGLLEKEFTPSNDAAGAVRELHRDEVEEGTGRRTIDFKTDLTEQQCRGMAVLDFLDVKEIFPSLSIFTHSLKRNLVSKERKGRLETVEIFRNVGTTAHRAGLFSKLFGKNNPPQQQNV